MTEILQDSLGSEIHYLTSDAQVSETLSAKDAESQPMKLWFGTEEDIEAEADEALVQPPPGSAAGPPPPNSLVKVYKRNGAGTMVAVIDSGINTSHEVFANKISPKSRSFVGGSIEDVNGHGTQCAGLVCGASTTICIDGSEHTFQSIAPNARVLVCKVVRDGTRACDIPASIQALNYILQYNAKAAENGHVTVSVVSISFGLLKFHYDLAMKLQEVVSSNIIVVCAASNDGATTQQPIAYPSRLGHVLCIGSCNSGGRNSTFSPRGRELDFLALGENVWAPTIGGPNKYAAVRGTSFSTPLVAGVVCQLVEDLNYLSSFYGDPSIVKHFHNVWGMRELLKCMSTIQGIHNHDEGFGVLEPEKYLKKTPQEKFSILSDLV